MVSILFNPRSGRRIDLANRNAVFVANRKIKLTAQGHRLKKKIYSTKIDCIPLES